MGCSHCSQKGIFMKALFFKINRIQRALFSREVRIQAWVAPEGVNKGLSNSLWPFERAMETLSTAGLRHSSDVRQIAKRHQPVTKKLLNISRFLHLHILLWLANFQQRFCVPFIRTGCSRHWEDQRLFSIIKAKHKLAYL